MKKSHCELKMKCYSHWTLYSCFYTNKHKEKTFCLCEHPLVYFSTINKSVKWYKYTVKVHIYTVYMEQRQNYGFPN